MLKILFLVIFSWLCLEVVGQEVTIQKSTDVIVLRGKSYYLHTVQPGQTLFSICKVYGVDVEEVKTLNDKKDNTLGSYEVLKIPYVEAFVQQDGQFFYHKVVKGETLYSIARFYEIKPKRLLKFNPSYSHNEPLSVGAVVRLPLDEIGLTRMREAEPQSHVDVIPEKEVSVQPVKEEDIVVKEEILDTLPVNRFEVVPAGEQQEMPDYLSSVLPSDHSFVKIALLLPLSAGDYPIYVDSLAGYHPVSISSRSEQFIGFYEGILLAVDSLKHLGYNIDLHVFDTERSSEKMYEMAQELNRLKPELIIGPVYGSVYKVLQDNLENKNIPVVYPLSSRSEHFGEYPNFVQVNSTFEVLAEEMYRWLQQQQREANVVHIDLIGSEESQSTEKRAFKGQLENLAGIHFFKWNLEEVPLDTLRTLLLPDRENILVLPVAKEAEISKVLPLLSALTDGYRITVLGLPEWQTFTSVDHETYYKLNTKLFTYSYVDYSSDAAVAFAEKYRKYFYTEPGSLVYKAFDMGLYFIELAAKYRDRTLEAIEYAPQHKGTSSFRFKKMKNEVGKENHGTYVVNYGSDYQLRIESWNQ